MKTFFPSPKDRSTETSRNEQAMMGGLFVWVVICLVLAIGETVINLPPLKF